jgi:endonuclease/exonuclease/phosphatase family metal-dependent hydrolase
MSRLGVMSFNVRQMDGEDGPQSWEFRKDLLVDVIARRRPGLLGAQEIFKEQASHLLAGMPALKCFGRGRYGDDRDKHNSIFYDADQFSLKQSDDLWISRTPNNPGSSDWGIPRPRMLTWGLLVDGRGRELFTMNTHFPYGRTADEARNHTARLIIEKLATLPKDQPFVLTTDANAPVGGEVYSSLTEHLKDAWLTAAKRQGPEGTVHGFGRHQGGRIDWILYRNLKLVHYVETVTDRAGDLYPSDHFPVYAEFDW